MSDDIFSRLFELFNQPGPVNLKLAAELARHLAGEKQPVDPWQAEEFRELTRLAEFRVEQVAPFAVHAAPDVLPVDGREWAERNLEGFRYLAEPFAGMVDFGGGIPGMEGMAGIGPALVGMQVGTLVGTLARWVMAGFDAGVPVRGTGPITFVVPTIDRFIREHDLDGREVRLWAALNETAHRALFQVPWPGEHLSGLLQAHAGAVKISPDQLMDMFQGFDPAQMESGFDPEQIAGLFDNPDSRLTQTELRAFLGLTAGYTRYLVEAAAGPMLPGLWSIYGLRDGERVLGDEAAGNAFAATFVESSEIDEGLAFCREVEKRYGADALNSIWTREGKFPTAMEITDPVAWAARVLLTDLDIDG